MAWRQAARIVPYVVPLSRLAYQYLGHRMNQATTSRAMVPYTGVGSSRPPLVERISTTGGSRAVSRGGQVTNMGGTKRRRTRKGKRGRKRGKKGGKGFQRKVLEAITPANWWTQEIGDTTTCGLTTAAGGPQAQYFVSTGPLVAAGTSQPSSLTTWHLPTLMRIANEASINSGMATSIATNFEFHVLKDSLIYEIQNFNVGHLSVAMYYCETRQDINSAATMDTIQENLEEGFRSSNIPGGETDVELTPFQAKAFVQRFRILKVRKVRVEGGCGYRVGISSKRHRKFNLSAYVVPNSATTWLTAVKHYSFIKGSRFILFKFWGQLASNVEAPALTFTNPKIAIHTIQRIQYRFLTRSVTNVKTNNAIGIAAEVFPPQIMNDESGGITTAGNA